MLRAALIAKYALLLMILNAFMVTQSNAASVPVDLPTAPPPDASGGLIELKKGKNTAHPSEYELRHRESNMQNVSSNTTTYDSDRTKAIQMINLLQDEELSKAFKKVTETGKRTLQQNPGIKAPIYLISGAAGFWAGKTLDLLKQESFRFSARFEGRSRRSEFNMSSPLLNGQMRFDSNLGNQFILHRNFEMIRTETSLQYRFQDQVISTEIRYRVAPNIDMTFGASRIDQSTKLEYRFNF
jgi:hypothetical protein